MRRWVPALAAAVLVAAASSGLAAWILWVRAHEPFKGYPEEDTFVEIQPGIGAAEIGRQLASRRVVSSELVFRAAVWWAGQSRSLKAGEYRFERPLAAADVVGLLARGEVYTRWLTFPEGLTIEEMAAVYRERGFGSEADFRRAAGDRSLVADLDADARDLEGYLFPDTYPMTRSTSASTLVAAMVARFRAVYDGALQARARAAGLTARQVVTLASLVEKETGRTDERALVAAVFHNRLKRGMAMQADPTIVYALRRTGRYDGNIRKQDLGLASPYNTYLRAGLPPGPIAAPGRAALEAALAPADVPYLYFVSRNDGTHVFARTLAEHNRNVARYQVQYFARGAKGAR
jgi:UPF0755 protein